MIKSLSHLEGVLGYSVAELKGIISDKENQHYHFARRKGVTKGVQQFRHFHPSKKNLRDVQNRIHSRIFSEITLPNHVQGCVKGRGNVTNTKPHQGKLYKLHTDLKAYFDFVTNRKVYDALRTYGFSQKVSYLLTQLTTFHGHLAQGPPTSPFLANIAALPLDSQILELCHLHGITYTRFVDDLALSSQEDFQTFVPTVVNLINAHGFFIGYKKTRYKAGRLEFTGVNVGQNLLRPTKKQLQKYYDPLTADHTRKGLDIYFAGLKKK